MDRDIAHTRALRDRIWTCLRAVSPTAAVNGPDPIADTHRRLPNNLHVSISGFETEAIGAALCQVAVSSRSACTSGSSEPSHVLKAIGRPTDEALSLRFGVGRSTTAGEVDYVVQQLQGTVTSA
jgi:cysteine desulfurase